MISYNFLEDFFPGVYVWPVSPFVIYENPINIWWTNTLNCSFIKQSIFEDKDSKTILEFIFLYNARTRLWKLNEVIIFIFVETMVVLSNANKLIMFLLQAYIEHN